MTRRRWMAGMLVVVATFAGCDGPPGPGLARQTPLTKAESSFIYARAIIIMRHADIDIALKATMGGTTPLLPRGEDRAKELITALKDAGVSRIVTSSSVRTKATTAPLAEALHLTPEIATGHGPESGSSGVKEEADKLVAYLRDNAKPNDVILVVYHHSVIPSILKDFGYEESPIEDATEFDRVYVIVPDPAGQSYKVMRLRYGGKWN